MCKCWLCSTGVTLTAPAAAAVETDWQEFGSMLFIRSVSGVRYTHTPHTHMHARTHEHTDAHTHTTHTTPHIHTHTPHTCPSSASAPHPPTPPHPNRVVQPGNKKTIGPTTFLNWGSHSNAYPHTYFTAAAALGMEKKEVDEFVHRLKKVFKKFSKRSDKMAAEEK